MRFTTQRKIRSHNHINSYFVFIPIIMKFDMQKDNGFFYKILYEMLCLNQQLNDNFDGVDI